MAKAEVPAWSMSRRTPKEPVAEVVATEHRPAAGRAVDRAAIARANARKKPQPAEVPPVGPLMDMAEACTYLNVSSSYVYELLSAGLLSRVALPSIKTGQPLRRLLFRRQDLDDFINRHVSR